MAELKAVKGEVFVPLSHRPGEARVDFGHAPVNLNGNLRKRPFFVMSLPYRDAFYVRVFERECTESCWAGHVRAFGFFGAVPTRISHDNSAVAVAQRLGGGKRKLTDGFPQPRSHYLFEDHFRLTARGKEKGESRREGAPQPGEFPGAGATGAHARRTQGPMGRVVLRGSGAAAARPGATQRGALTRRWGPRCEGLRRPPSTRAGCWRTRASNLSLVRFDGNDHSVPMRCAHREVVAKGDCERVRIHRDEERVAEHRRIWERERVRFDPVHYLALLERNPGALDFARPPEGWELPECPRVLRRRLEADHGSEGTKEYIGVLRLLEKHSLARLKAARQLGCPRKELIERYLYGEDRECATFRLEGREHLKGVNVGRTDPGDHTALLEGKGGRRVRVESNRLPLKHHLGKLRLPTIRREWEGAAASGASDGQRLRGFFASTHRVDRTRTESRPAAHQEREVPGAQDAG